MDAEYITCKKCFQPAKTDIPVCRSCGEPFPDDILSKYNLPTAQEFLAGSDSLDAALAEQKAEQKLRESEIEANKIEEAAARQEWDKVPASVIADKSADIILTTSSILPSNPDYDVLEVISAECVFGMNVFRDMFAGIRDIIGGRSSATQKVLRDARRTALTELRREALMIDADAVIGIDLDYQELSGGGKSGMLMIVASGTAVALKKKDDANDGS